MLPNVVLRVFRSLADCPFSTVARQCRSPQSPPNQNNSQYLRAVGTFRSTVKNRARRRADKHSEPLWKRSAHAIRNGNSWDTASRHNGGLPDCAPTDCKSRTRIRRLGSHRATHRGVGADGASRRPPGCSSGSVRLGAGCTYVRSETGC